VIARAASTDCILIAGKGHEDYQEINGIKSPFSDKTCVLEALKNREAG
jgi:UDP-N-acetylmuramoyl-L-alanyl-D-glutamate--2,6-diaminopimelate ligase